MSIPCLPDFPDSDCGDDRVQNVFPRLRVFEILHQSAVYLLSAVLIVALVPLAWLLFFALSAL